MHQLCLSDKTKTKIKIVPSFSYPPLIIHFTALLFWIRAAKFYVKIKHTLLVACYARMFIKRIENMKIKRTKRSKKVHHLLYIHKIINFNHIEII